METGEVSRQDQAKITKQKQISLVAFLDAVSLLQNILNLFQWEQSKPANSNYIYSCAIKCIYILQIAKSIHIYGKFFSTQKNSVSDISCHYYVRSRKKSILMSTIK